MDYLAALTAFVEAADASNFSRAAEKLGIKASTVSRYVKDLEQDLGIALFNRSTRMLHLTEGGQTFLVHARRVLIELEQARAATSALNQHPRGLLKLNLPPAFARHHILPALKSYLTRFPDVRVELALDDSLVNLINSGTDLAIRIGRLADSNLKARKIADVTQWLVVAPNFVFENTHPSSPADLQGSTAIMAPDASLEIIFSNQAEQISRLMRLECLKIDDLDAQLIAVKQGLGYALLPDWLVAKSIEAGDLRVLLPEWTAQSANEPAAIWFIYPPKRIVSSKVRCFIDFIIERLGSPPHWKI